MHKNRVSFFLTSVTCAIFVLLVATHTYAETPSALLTKTGVADKDKALLTGGCASDPYTFLFTRYRPGPQSATEGKNGILKLNADFACRLSNYLQKRPHIGILSAYRGVETQTRLWNAKLKETGGDAKAARKWVAPPGSSMHNKGLAADLTGVRGQDQSSAPQDKLHFRMAHEGWHIEPLGSVSGGAGAGDPNAEPLSPLTADGSPLSSGSPAASLAQAFRGATGLGGQPSPTPQQTGSAQPTQYFPTATSPSGGSSGAAPSTAVTPTTSIAPTTITPVTAEENKIPISDQLLGIAYPELSSATTATSGSPVKIDGTDKKMLEDTKSETTSETTSPVSKTIPSPTNTFISDDLSTEENVSITTDENGMLVAFLASLRESLTELLEILRPFGIRTAIEGGTDYTYEHAE